MSALPRGWLLAEVGDVAFVQGGIQKQPKRRPTDNKFPFLRVANVLRNRLDLQDIHDVELFDGELETYRLVPGDLLVVEGNGSPSQIGRSALWTGEIPDCVHQNHLIRVRPSVAVVPKYLNYFWNSPATTEHLRSMASSTSGLYVLTGAKVRSVSMPLPPLAEQHRIVTAIEEQFSRLDVADELLRHAGRRLNTLPSRLLDRALSGWPTKPLGEFLREPLRNGHSAKRTAEGDIPVFTLTAVTKRDFSERNTKLTAADPRRVEDLWVQPGDIFIERSNAPELVGTAALYNGAPRMAIFPDLLIRVRVGPSLLPAFAELALRSTSLRRYFQRRAKGIAGSMPKIDQSMVLEAELPVPPLEVQERLVADVDRDLTMTETLSTAISRTLTRSDHLRRAVLSQAFSGRLVRQDPSDEPASELLVRTAAARVNAPKARRKART